jgi:colanic acid/amylovoran biosynthesis protein
MRIAITNSVALNGGDAAITLALHEGLLRHFPHAEIEVHDASPHAAQKYYPELQWSTQVAALLGPRVKVPKLGASRQRMNELRILRGLTASRSPHPRPSLLTADERAALSRYSRADVAISTGGTYLVEQYALHPRLFEYRVANALDIPLAFFTQSLGPFLHARNRRLLAQIFGDARLVLLRDEESLANVRTLGVSNARMRVVADGVFLSGMPQLAFPVRKGADDPWRIGVSVRNWPPGSNLDHPAVLRFAQAIVQSITQIARLLPTRILFISTCQGTPEYHVDDSALAAHIVAALPPDVKASTEVDSSFHTPSQFREIVGSLDLVIATRMHAAIQSLVVGTPVVPIAYEFKTRQLADRLGIGDYTLDIGSVSGTSLADNVMRFIEALDDLREPLAIAVREQRAAAEKGLTELVDTLRPFA